MANKDDEARKAAAAAAQRAKEAAEAAEKARRILEEQKKHRGQKGPGAGEFEKGGGTDKH